MVSDLELHLSFHVSNALQAALIKQRSITKPGNNSMYKLHDQIFLIAK